MPPPPRAADHQRIKGLRPPARPGRRAQCVLCFPNGNLRSHKLGLCTKAAASDHCLLCPCLFVPPGLGPQLSARLQERQGEPGELGVGRPGFQAINASRLSCRHNSP